MYDIAAQLWLGGVSHTVLLFLAIAIVGIITVRWIMAQLRGCQKQATDAQKVRNRGETPQILGATPLSGDSYCIVESIYQKEEEEEEHHKEKVHVLQEQVNMLQGRLQWTSLHTAAGQGDVNTFKTITVSDVNIKDKNGRTPLHIAVEEGQECTVEYLIMEGADVNIKDSHGMTPLHMAAKRGCSYLVGYLIDKEADINIKDDNGRTPLHIAVRGSYKDIVECLMKKGADINTKDNNEMAPLHMAAERGRFYLVEKFARKQADINIKNDNGRTPLHIAVREGQEHTVDCLVTEGADINIKDNDGMTPLHVVAETGGHLNIVKYLVGKEADINIKDNNGQTPLHIAVREGYMRTVERLVMERADINIQDYDGMTLLHVAAERGRFHIVEYLVGKEAGKKVINIQDNKGQTALHIAARDGQERTVGHIVEGGADINIKDNNGRTPLEVANERSHVKIAKLLSNLNGVKGRKKKEDHTQGRRTTKPANELQKIKDDYQKEVQPLQEQVCVLQEQVRVLQEQVRVLQEQLQEQLQWTALHTAAGQGDVDAVNFNADRVADINVKDKNGMTPLHMAAKRGRFFLVEIFVSKGANINIKDNTGRTPLHMAVREGQKHTVECIIDQGADINIKDNDGMTPLHVAAERGVNSDIVKYLVDKEADINIKDNNGQTPLHMAVREGKEDAVESLLANKATVSIKDNDGMSPLHVAAERGRVCHIVGHLTCHDEEAINIQDNSGRTPLHIAARDGQWYTVKYLVKNKADVNIEDNDGKTPLDVAKERGHMKIADFLSAQDPVTQDLTKLKKDIKQELLLHRSKSHPKKLPEPRGYLRGVDVIAETSVQVTNQSQTFHWADYGLKLHIPQKALPANLEECKLLIKVALSGQFALPEETSLVSAVYWLDSEPRCKFSQPLTIEVQHCATSSQISRLTFALARCSQNDLPYTFKILEGGKFSSHSTYGCIQLNHFSLITLVKRLILGEDNVKYRARLYYLKKNTFQRDIHFVITKDQEAYATVVQQKYTNKHTTSGPDLSVQFESENISLKLPTDGITLENGWKIVPQYHPMIEKEKVDSFKLGQGIPSCQLTAVWTKQNKPSLLIHKVTLEGAKEPFNYLNMVLGDSDSDSTSQAGLYDKYPDGLGSQPELSDLMNEVAAKIPGKWQDVGLQLGMDKGVLDGIALISPGNNNHCYTNVFSRWKNQNLATHPYTWSTVVHVLKSPAVGQNRLAGEIKNKLTGQPQQ